MKKIGSTFVSILMVFVLCACQQEIIQEKEVSIDQNVLVAYFSATNTTEGIANMIADALDADVFEITPEEPYTQADLDYNDDNSRTSLEMNDPAARPAISNQIEDMETYDVVFIGYPIWWSKAPRIIDTFLESYDFSNKTLIPFCTSGGSGIEGSIHELHELAVDAHWVDGRRFNGSSSTHEVIEWLDSIGLS